MLFKDLKVGQRFKVGGYYPDEESMKIQTPNGFNAVFLSGRNCGYLRVVQPDCKVSPTEPLLFCDLKRGQHFRLLDGKCIFMKTRDINSVEYGLVNTLSIESGSFYGTNLADEVTLVNMAEVDN